MSAYNTTHFGTAVFNNHQNAYIFFNEREAPQLALSTIYLQLPMYDFPHLLKGLYLCLDYNRNPIARRILCNLIGQWVEDGEYPNDEKALEKIVKGICFDNAKRYFNL